MDVQPLELLACYDGFSDNLLVSLAVAPSGKQFVVGGAKLTLWNATEPKPSLDLLSNYKHDEVERPILTVDISPDGELVAAGDSKGVLRAWKLSDQRELFATPAHEGRVSRLVFSPDSKSIATTSFSGEVRLWQSADGKKLKSVKVDSQELARLAFGSDTLLATAGRETALWNVETGEKSKTLTHGNVIHPALGLSGDRRWLAYADSDSQTKIWDLAKDAPGGTLPGVAAHWIDFSPDGKWIATYTGDSVIRIWDVARRSVVQSIDADGDRTAALKWLPSTSALMVVTEQGRVRIWGAAETAQALGIEPLQQPALRPITADARVSYSPARFGKIIDVRSFPRLPDAVPTFSYSGSETYGTRASQPEAELFYRYYLSKAGWQENVQNDPMQPGLNFRKDSCALNVAFNPAMPSDSGGAAALQVTLRFAGNYDVRWLPQISPIKSQSSWASFSSMSYRTREMLTDVEVGILRKFHEAGWTAYSRLDAAGNEDSRSRSISMLQGGSELTVSIGYPADSTSELVVQTSVNVSNKALPLPPDCGWIEFSSATDLTLVANTKLDLPETIGFFDREMPLDGWLAREAGRHIDEKSTEPEKEQRAWLPYLRGQQDVLIRLVSLPDGKTRIIVGDAERTSWQLEKPRPSAAAAEQAGVEAADFPLPKGASAVRYDVDQKQIQFELTSLTATRLAEQFVQQMEALDWKRDGAGILGDDYSFLTYTKQKAEIQLRAHGKNNKTTAMISGDGLLWSKPLPAAPVRISYETWLRRNRHPATLDLLDEFAEEMHKIAASGGNAK